MNACLLRVIQVEMTEVCGELLGVYRRESDTWDAWRDVDVNTVVERWKVNARALGRWRIVLLVPSGFDLSSHSESDRILDSLMIEKGESG